jgi:hypothetical protein
LLRQAQALPVRDDLELVAAGERLLVVIQGRKNIAAKFAPVIEAAHRAHKQALKLRDEVDAPFAQAERLLRDSRNRYSLERQRRQEDEARRQQEEARKAREAAEAQERARLEAEREAERKRLWAEGKRREAAAVKAAPLPEVVIPEAPPATPPPPPPKEEGFSQRVHWRWELEDASKIPDQYWQVNEKLVGELVRKLGKDAESAIPGISVYPQLGESVRVG